MRSCHYHRRVSSQQPVTNYKQKKTARQQHRVRGISGEEKEINVMRLHPSLYTALFPKIENIIAKRRELSHQQHTRAQGSSYLGHMSSHVSLQTLPNPFSFFTFFSGGLDDVCTYSSTFSTHTRRRRRRLLHTHIERTQVCVPVITLLHFAQSLSIC